MNSGATWPTALLALAVTSGACMMPSAAPYRPATDDEGQLYARARRDVLPADVRNDPESTSNTLVGWTGIVREIRTSDQETTFVVEHFYWDWMLDFGTQSPRIFLSQQGEGTFQFSVVGRDGEWLAEHSTAGDMLVVYGMPTRVAHPDAIVVLRYVHARGFPEHLYSTDVWDYGRDFAAKGQGAPTLLNMRSF